MKKLITIFMAVAMSVMAFAQEGNRDADGRFVYGPYETNRFVDNWFVETGAGINVPVDNLLQIFKGGLTYDFGGLAVGVNVGKWIDSVYGFRLGWQGFTNGNLDNHTTFQGSFEGTNFFNYVHGDFMVNASNLFAGYKERRAVNVVPYLTAGAEFAHGARALAVGGGVQLPVRISNVVAIVPQLQALASNSNVYGGSGVTVLGTATVSVRVNLGRNNFKRVASTVAPYAAELADVKAALENARRDVETANGKVAELQGEVKNLKDAANNKCEVIPNVSYVDELGVSRFVLYFDKGKSVLSDKELEHLDFYVKNIVENSKKVKFVVAGATDSATGSEKRNATLRKARAEYVCNLLADKYGVGSRIAENEIGLVDFVNVPELSRAVVITAE